MNIIINGKPYKINDGSTIADALKEAQINNQFGIAVAVNNMVISKTKWEKYIVQNNDNILIINAIFGG
jgi:sulfur carrier protein